MGCRRGLKLKQYKSALGWKNVTAVSTPCNNYLLLYHISFQDFHVFCSTKYRDMWTTLFAKEARDIHTIPYPWWKLSIEYCWWFRNLTSYLTLGRCTMGSNKCAAGAVGQNSFISSVIQIDQYFSPGVAQPTSTQTGVEVLSRSFFAFSFIHSAFPGVLCRTMRRRTDPTFR